MDEREEREADARWEHQQSLTDELRSENRHRQHVEDGVPLDAYGCQICEDLHNDDHDGDNPTPGCAACEDAAAAAAS